MKTRISRKKQQELDLGAAHSKRTEHGGEIRVGKRKLARPIDPKRPMHIVLRSEKAKGELSLLRHGRRAKIETLANRLGKRYGVRTYQFANSGNHLHLLLRAKTRKGLQDFLRVFSGKVAQLVTAAKKGRAFGRFWEALAYSRVVEWGKAFIEAKAYVLRNALETDGIIDYFRKAPRAGPVRRV